MPNHLINENSPYLIQHAENPVDWYPWGDEALEIARRDNKPIFLSIGYAACHWCHVMAHESFEDPETASFMNMHFVNIKVDREERPDLDSIYMSAVVAISGQGGWPMSVFLTPEGQPFYGGTYYPPVPRYNMPSFREVLARIYQVWSQDQQQVIGSANKVSEYIQQTNQIPISGQGIRAETLEKAAFSLGQSYDWKFGGWGSAPKFPQPMAIEFLLRRAVRGDRFALDIAAHALQAMSKGGMYDVIGGGFARYSTDNYWLVPHFEKMLYDNALLASAYLHAYLVTGDAAYRQVCESTLDFINREMTHPAGGFYSSLDADSEGREGSFYLWTLQDVRSALQDESDIKLFTAAYTISEAGNFDGANILQRAKTDLQLADQFAISEVEVRERLSELHSRLLRIRQRRVRPATDDKVLVAWNALALIAFSEAARYLQRDDYLDIARKNADFLLKQLWVDGHLLRSWREGQARHNAYLEDYAGLILGLLALYQSDPETSWFASANELTNEMVQHFRDPNIGFFDTRDDHEMLITRPKDIQDNATPSGNAQAATALILMAAYTGNGEWRDIAESMLASVEHQAARYPIAFSQWLCAIDAALSDFKQIAIVGDTTDSATQSLRHIVWQVFRPNLVLAASKLPVPDQAPPLLHQRTMINHLPTAYVCQDFVCQLPVTDPRQLEKQLAPS